MKWSAVVATIKEGRLRLLVVISQLLFGYTHPRTARALTSLALHLRSQEKQEKAGLVWNQVKAIMDARGQSSPFKNLGMQEVIAGVHKFQRKVFKSEQDLFERLAHGQHPEVLFITCSDSRIGTLHITQGHPGELFVLRNAGNIVPLHNADSGGEEASIEYAVRALAVKDIIICGHSDCGAIKGLLHPEKLSKLPSVAAWLNHAAETRMLAARHKHEGLDDSEILARAIKDNVVVQLQHLSSLPCVKDVLFQGKLNLHGWVYNIESGEVEYHDAHSKSWRKL